MHKSSGVFWSLLILLSIVIFSVCAEKSPQFINSVGMKMILIPDGTFRMGEGQNIPLQENDIATYLRHGDYDVKPERSNLNLHG
jgi:hypothetical protein